MRRRILPALLAIVAWHGAAFADGISFVPLRTGNSFTFWTSDPSDLSSGDCLQITASTNATGSGAQCNGGVQSITTDCPVGSPLVGAVTLSGLLSNQRTVAGTTDTLLSTDCGGIINYTSASAVAISVPTALGTGFPIGYWVGLKNSGTNTLTLTPVSGTINGAGTFGIAAGQDVQLLASGAGTYLTMSTDGTASGAGTFSLIDGRFYPLWDRITNSAGTAPGTNHVGCSPFRQTNTAGVHWDQIIAGITTAAASGNVQFALYADGLNTSTSPGFHAPVGAALQSSGSISTASTGAAVWSVGTGGVGVAIPSGPLWICSNVDTSANTAAFSGIVQTTPYIGSLIGAALSTKAGISSGSNNDITGLLLTQTFGTWPTWTTSTVWTEQNNSSLLAYAYRFVSSP